MERASGTCVEVLPSTRRPGPGLRPAGQAPQFLRERQENRGRVLAVPLFSPRRHRFMLGKVLSPQLPQSTALGFANAAYRGFAGRAHPFCHASSSSGQGRAR